MPKPDENAPTPEVVEPPTPTNLGPEHVASLDISDVLDEDGNPR